MARNAINEWIGLGSSKQVPGRVPPLPKTFRACQSPTSGRERLPRRKEAVVVATLSGTTVQPALLTRS